MSSFIHKGFPKIFGKETKEDERYISVDGSSSHQSEPFNLEGEAVGTVLLPAIEGYRYVIKGITMQLDGNSGELLPKLTHKGTTESFLPLWASNFNKASTSTALNLVCDPNTAVTVDSISIGASTKFFIGLSFVVEKV